MKQITTLINVFEKYNHEENKENNTKKEDEELE